MKKAMTLVVAALLVWPCLSQPGFAQADTCAYDPPSGVIICNASGGTPPVPGPPGEPRPEPDPIRYVYTAIDPVVGECFYWSRIPGGLDSWDPANDAAIIFIVTRLPECPGPAPGPEPGVDGRAWDIFRAFPLSPPSVGLAPAEHGITGLPTHLAVPEPAPITHTETLPDGRVLEVRAQVVALFVDWGDGTSGFTDIDAALGYPDGSVTHVYRLKTCPPDYRSNHPAGVLCHPSLEAYPVTVTLTWGGAYRTGGQWVPLGTLDLATSVEYDVDEVVGTLRP